MAEMRTLLDEQITESLQELGYPTDISTYQVQELGYSTEIST